MYKGLLTQALAKLFLGVIILGILIFLPAGLSLLARLVADGHSFRAHVCCRTCDDDQQRERTRGGAEDSREVEWIAFYYRLCGSRVELALWLVAPAELGSMGGSMVVLGIISLVCGSASGEYLPVSDYRGPGESEGY